MLQRWKASVQSARFYGTDGWKVQVSRLISQQVTALLSAWRSGNKGAQDRLFQLVYKDLHRVASRYMSRERPEHTLQATALVNEAYIRLIGMDEFHWQDRAHFFSVAARVMRRILVDSARARRFQKRGGGAASISLDEALMVTGQHGPDLVALDDALSALSAMDERKGRVVELRFFGGLSAAETAAVLGVSDDTVLRDWKMAKVWLLREIKRGFDGLAKEP
jgi:RNA polymerase sigma factor (TIGR02999 family)